MNDKTGVKYKSTDTYATPAMPTKHGYIQFVFKPVEHDLSWVAVNNKTRE